MKPKELNIQVASPCDEPWDRMIGDANVRRCLRCDKSVFNLSAMTMAEVQEMVHRTGNKFCRKYYLRNDGTVMLDDCPIGLRNVRTRIAKVAFTAVSLAGALFAIREPHRRLNDALAGLERTRIGGLGVVRHAVYAYRMQLHGSIPDARKNSTRFPQIELEPYDGTPPKASGLGFAVSAAPIRPAWPYVGIGTIKLKETAQNYGRSDRNFFSVSGS